MEHTESHIANLSASIILDARYTLDFQRRVCSEEYLWCILNCSPSCINELLNEDLAKHSVCLLPKDSAKNHSDSVVAGFDVDSFLVAVMNGHNIASFPDTLWRFFRRKLGSLFCQFVVLIKSMFEGCGHSISFQKRNSPDQVVSCF